MPTFPYFHNFAWSRMCRRMSLKGFEQANLHVHEKSFSRCAFDRHKPHLSISGPGGFPTDRFSHGGNRLFKFGQLISRPTRIEGMIYIVGNFRDLKGNLTIEAKTNISLAKVVLIVCTCTHAWDIGCWFSIKGSLGCCGGSVCESVQN